jgi:DNA-binding NtrC family response regulator
MLRGDILLTMRMLVRPQSILQDAGSGTGAETLRSLRRFAQVDRNSAERRPCVQGPILVVEDDFLVAMQVEAALGEAGFALAGSAASAEEAMQMVEQRRPALVLMDIRLAGKMDGVDGALALFRKHGIRCVFATAHHDLEVRQRAAPAQPLGWLQKPYTMPAMVAAVRLALEDLAADSD